MPDHAVRSEEPELDVSLPAPEQRRGDLERAAKMLAAIEARASGVKVRPKDVDETSWALSRALELNGIDRADVEQFLVTGELGGGNARFEELEKKARGGSWTAVNSMTALLGLVEARTTAEGRTDVAAAIASWRQEIYRDASIARERSAMTKLARAEKLEREAAKIESSQPARAAELIAKASTLRAEAAKIAHDEGEYRASVKAYDAKSAFLLAAEAQIASGRSEVLRMAAGKLPLSEALPMVLGGARASLDEAAKIGAANDRQLAAESSLLAITGDFHALHPGKEHRKAYLGARAKEAAVIGDRLKLLSADPKGRTAIFAGDLEARRAAIYGEMASSAERAVASEEAAEKADDRLLKLAAGLGLEALELVNASVAETEAKETYADAIEAGGMTDFFKSKKEIAHEEKRRADAAVLASAAESSRKLEEGDVAHAMEALGKGIQDRKRAKQVEAAALEDAALVGEALGITGDPKVLQEKVRGMADESAIASAEHYDRAESAAPLDPKKARAFEVELAARRSQLAQYWIGSAELDPAPVKRLETASQLADQVDGVRASLPENDARAALATELVSVRSQLGAAWAAHDAAKSIASLEDAEWVANDLAGEAKRKALGMIGSSAVAGLVRHEMAGGSAASDELHRIGTELLVFAGDLPETKLARELLGEIDRQLELVDDMIDAAKKQIDGGRRIAKAQVGLTSVNEVDAERAKAGVFEPRWKVERRADELRRDASIRELVVDAAAFEQKAGLASLEKDWAKASAEGRRFAFLHGLSENDPRLKEVPIARALTGPVLAHSAALEAIGSPEAGVITERMRDQIEAQAKSYRDTTDGMMWLIAANTAVEVAAGFVLTAGIGSGAAVAKGAHTIWTVGRAAGTALAVGGATSLLSHGVGRVVGRHTAAAAMFDTAVGFIPFSASQRVTGMGNKLWNGVFAGFQAGAISLATPHVSSAIGADSELGRAAVGVGLGALAAGSFAALSSPKHSGPSDEPRSVGIFDRLRLRRDPMKWSAEDARDVFYERYDGTGMARLSAFDAKELAETLGDGPYPVQLAELASIPGYVELARRDPAAARQLLSAYVSEGINVPKLIDDHGFERTIDHLQAGEGMPWAYQRGHFGVRRAGARAGDWQPGLKILAERSIDKSGAFRARADVPKSVRRSGAAPTPLPSAEIVDRAQVIGTNGRSVADLRQVAVFGAHGSPIGFGGISMKEAAALVADEVIKANGAVDPSRHIKYVLLASCNQGERRFGLFGPTNAQAFQKLLTEELKKRDPGISIGSVEPATVLASDRPGSLYGYWHKVKGEFQPARFIPASQQNPSRLVPNQGHLILLGGISAAATGAAVLIELVRDD